MAIYAASVVVAVLAVVLIGVALRSDDAVVWASPLIAVGALAVALSALRHSSQSAAAATKNVTLAMEQELRGRYGWQAVLRADGEKYILRNTGSVNAQNVRLSGSFARIGFLDVDDTSTVNIGRGESRVFTALNSYSQFGVEVTITWTPEGEDEDRTWVEAVPPTTNAFFAEAKQQRQVERVREAEHQREDAREARETILRLGDAYSEWKIDKENAAKKLRVQLLVAALPPHLAREIGFEVDVARDVWGPSEYPFGNKLTPDDRELIKGLEAEIELIWNMWNVMGYSVYGRAEQGARGEHGYGVEHRIWSAMMGYVGRVRERESGERKLRDSPQDAEARRERMKMFEDMETRRRNDSSRTAETQDD